jgi:hypothetical protein
MVKENIIGNFQKKIKLVSLIIILAILTMLFISCSALLPVSDSSTENGQEQQDTGNGSSEITDQASGDSISSEENMESVETVDYASAKVAAEMRGYVPSFLSTVNDNYIEITITNNSDFEWRNEKPAVVRIGYHYYGQDVDYSDYDKTVRTPLPNPVKPGETITVRVLVNDIKNPGYYVIQIDPVLEANTLPEDNFWFSNKGVTMLEGKCYFGTAN